MTPRVCVVSALYHPSLGGLGRQAMLLTERLRKEGVELFVVSRTMEGMPPAEFSPDVEVIRVPCLFPKIHVFEEVSFRHILLSLSYSAGIAAALVRRRRRYDIVHFHGASIPLFVSLPFPKIMGKKVVAKVAAANLGTEAGSLSGRYWFAGDLLARMMRGVDAFIAISDEIREGLLRDGIGPERIHRIANFVDPETFRPPAPGEKERLKADLGYAGRRLVLFSGRLVPRKGVEHLLDAWREASPRYPEARLLILGDGPLREPLEEAAGRLGLSSTVRFGGRVDNVPALLRAADLFVLPSLQEGLSNSLLEAMASGLPAAASRIGGVVDVAEDGRTALLVPPGDGKALAGALADLLDDGALRERLGAAALETIRESYGLESRVRLYRDLYGSLCPGRRPSPPAGTATART